MISRCLLYLSVFVVASVFAGGRFGEMIGRDFISSSVTDTMQGTRTNHNDDVTTSSQQSLDEHCLASDDELGGFNRWMIFDLA